LRKDIIVMKLACAADKIKTLAPSEVQAILDKDKKGEFLLLDVRQPEEYEAGHIPGATFIPLGELEARQEELERDKKIITYCRSGHRSMAAAIALCGLGFKDVHHLEGGILNWLYETIGGIPEAKPELVTEAADVRDILMLAIKLEKGSRDFYLAAKEKAASPQAKERFQMLADAEDGHMQRLWERAIILLGKGALPPLEKLKQELKVEYMEGAIEVSPALAKVTEKFSDEMEALEIALEKEYMSYDFYKRTSTLVEDPGAKTLLHELAMEERNHADILIKRVSEMVR
jgi:rhodanese-related sulfurtransferase/rubrerythrin